MVATETLTIHTTDTPSLEQIKIWWAEMQVDPTRFWAYPDYMPTDLDIYLEMIQQGEVTVWLFTVDGDNGHPRVGGAYYLHDGGEDANGRYSWFGTYIMPGYRGHIAAMAWDAIYQQWVEQGLSRFFAAIRATNRPARQFITQSLGFTRLGIYQDWAPFQGVLDRMTIFTHRREDQSLAWVLAEQRAQVARDSMVSVPRPLILPRRIGRKSRKRV